MIAVISTENIFFYGDIFMKNKKNIILFAVVILCSLVSIIIIAAEPKTRYFINFESISILLTLASVCCLVVEMNGSRRIAESEFISNLNNMFVGNEDYKKAYTLLDAYSGGDLELDNASISNYLTFFEVFWILKEENTINFQFFDDLFAYRFFIAVHNPYIQKKKLVFAPFNFCNIYKLEKEWIEYRKAKGKPIYKPEYSLENVLDNETYKKVIK